MNKNSFLLGMGAGIGLVILFILNVFLFYKAGNKIVDTVEQYYANIKFGKIKSIVENFSLNFEDMKQGSIFSGDSAGVMVVSDPLKQDNHYFQVEFPAGASFPGIIFELPENYGMNWQADKEFLVDIYNPGLTPVKITVKLKSGLKYPKRSYEKNFVMPQGKWVTARIGIDELREKLDVTKISYIKYFISDPATTYNLYFDNFRVSKD